MPFDELKIDRSLLAHAHERPDDATIVASTIELAHRMKLRVVAEGVETSENWNLLRRLGCDLAQGYLVSPPIPPDKIPPFVREANQLLQDSDSTQRQIQALRILNSIERSCQADPQDRRHMAAKNGALRFPLGLRVQPARGSALHRPRTLRQRQAILVEHAIAGERGHARFRRDQADEVERVRCRDSAMTSPSCGLRRMSRSMLTASGVAYCSPEKPATKRPPRISPRASRRRQHIRMSRHGGNHGASAASSFHENDAPATQERADEVLDRFAAACRHRWHGAQSPCDTRAQRPESAMPNSAIRRPRRPPARGRRRSDGSSRARRPTEAVGVHDAERDELGDGFFHLRGQHSRFIDDLVEEGRAVRLDDVSNVFRAGAEM